MSDGPQSELPVGGAFVLQFGAETDPHRGRFVGRVEHVASGRSVRFATTEGALAFMTWILTTPGLLEEQ